MVCKSIIRNRDDRRHIGTLVGHGNTERVRFPDKDMLEPVTVSMLPEELSIANLQSNVVLLVVAVRLLNEACGLAHFLDDFVVNIDGLGSRVLSARFNGGSSCALEKGSAADSSRNDASEVHFW